MTLKHIPFSIALDIVGDGTGSQNANVNGAVTPVEFKLAGISVATLHVARLLVSIRDDANVAAEKYGGLAMLTNGLDVECLFDSKTIDLLDGLKIKSNVDWGRACYDVQNQDFGVGNSFVQARWTFAKTGLDLVLGLGDEFIIRVNDDLSALVEHTFVLQGTVEELVESTEPARFFGAV